MGCFPDFVTLDPELRMPPVASHLVCKSLTLVRALDSVHHGNPIGRHEHNQHPNYHVITYA